MRWLPSRQRSAPSHGGDRPALWLQHHDPRSLHPPSSRTNLQRDQPLQTRRMVACRPTDANLAHCPVRNSARNLWQRRHQASHATEKLRHIAPRDDGTAKRATFLQVLMRDRESPLKTCRMRCVEQTLDNRPRLPGANPIKSRVLALRRSPNPCPLDPDAPAVSPTPHKGLNRHSNL